MLSALHQLWYSHGRLYRIEEYSPESETHYALAKMVEVARDERVVGVERAIVENRLEGLPGCADRLAEFDRPSSFIADSKWFEWAPKWPDRGYWAGTVEKWLERRSAA